MNRSKLMKFFAKVKLFEGRIFCQSIDIVNENANVMIAIINLSLKLDHFLE